MRIRAFIMKQPGNIRPIFDSEEFISEMKGCVSGSKIKPAELKEIWGIKHTHH